MELLAVACFGFMVFYLNHQNRVDRDASQLTVTVPKLGRVLGSRMFSTSGRKFQAFRGIHYAEPPVKDLRFKAPVPRKSWGKKLLDATQEGPMCIQYDTTSHSDKETEDCLALNIYTPSTNYTQDSLPVMVWIHGGNWFMGSGNDETDLYGPGHLLSRDIVLVTINYRVGALGFLSTDDIEAPGNYGLLDQNLALKWIQNNIKYFGGNPNLVTIFGASAGAASVEFHMLSPLSKGLFHRAIAHSGSSRCRWAIKTNMRASTYELAKLVNCTNSSTRLMMKCLRKKDWGNVPFSKNGINSFNPVAFGPRVDFERKSPFLPGYPDKLIQRKQFISVPFISGLTENEGALVGASLALSGSQLLKEFQKDPINSIRYSMGMEHRQDGHSIAQQVYKHYFLENIKKPTFEQYGELMSDFAFFKCVDESVSLFSRFSNSHVYYYNFAHRGKISKARSSLSSSTGVDFGVAHGDDLYLLFTSKKVPGLWNPDDVKVSNILLDLWTTFALTGVPISRRITDVWKPVKKSKAWYLKIEAKHTTLVEGPMPFKNKLAFLDGLLGSPSA